MADLLQSTSASKLGFKFGERGTHTSRTIMLAELSRVMDAVPPEAGRSGYATAIIEDNVTSKQTAATRRLTNQRLGELYVLDPAVVLFRGLRRCWALDDRGRPVLALLCCLARDPLLRATSEPVLRMPPGTELSRQDMTDALRDAVGNRLNEGILDKVVRNAASSWTQSGHLRGRGRKTRQRVSPTPLTTGYALMLGYLLGLRGIRLFQTPWTRVLDSSTSELLALAADAKRLGVLDLKQAGDVVEVAFPTLLTDEERALSRGTH